jgi:hypothetical protein
MAIRQSLLQIISPDVKQVFIYFTLEKLPAVATVTGIVNIILNAT